MFSQPHYRFSKEVGDNKCERAKIFEYMRLLIHSVKIIFTEILSKEE